jgi:hypothetical protein
MPKLRRAVERQAQIFKQFTTGLLLALVADNSRKNQNDIEELKRDSDGHVLDAQRLDQRGFARVHQELGARRPYHRHDLGRLSKEQDMKNLTRREFSGKNRSRPEACLVSLLPASAVNGQQQEEGRCRQLTFHQRQPSS